MSPPLQRHPRYAELRDEFGAHPGWFTPWSGTLFRFQTVEYPTPAEILSGRGADQHGGRWNPPGLPSVYGSTTDTTALEESKVKTGYYSLPNRQPRLLVAIDTCLPSVLDLTRQDIRRSLDLTLPELAAEDWRKLLAAGRESLTQTLGRAVVAAGGNGLLVRSAAVTRGVNGVIFPGNCQAGWLKVVEGDRLERLGMHTRV